MSQSVLAEEKGEARRSGQLEDFAPDPKRRYLIQAQFTGKAVPLSGATLDAKAIALMPYRTATAVSNTLAIGSS
jgi:hypothetical protein